MKRVILAAAIISAVLFIGCDSKDSESGQSRKNPGIRRPAQAGYKVGSWRPGRLCHRQNVQTTTHQKQHHLGGHPEKSDISVPATGMKVNFGVAVY